MRSIRAARLLGVWLAVGLMAPIALADQTDKRLDALFHRLKTTDSSAEAETLTSQIWAIWLESNSETVNALMAEGINEMSRRNYETALAAFTKVVEIEPEFAEGWNRRATVYYLIGDYAASVRDVERTIALEPRHFGGLSGLGYIYSALGDDLAALQAFEAALKINPYLPGAGAYVNELHRRLRRNAI